MTSVRRESRVPLREAVGVLGKSFGAEESVVATEMDHPQVVVNRSNDASSIRRVINEASEAFLARKVRVRNPDWIEIANDDQIRETGDFQCNGVSLDLGGHQNASALAVCHKGEPVPNRYRRKGTTSGEIRIDPGDFGQAQAHRRL